MNNIKKTILYILAFSALSLTVFLQTEAFGAQAYPHYSGKEATPRREARQTEAKEARHPKYARQNVSPAKHPRLARKLK